VAVIDMTRKTLTLKIVYYGCAKSGKTTNLVSLHRLTDPDGNHGMVSIATKDDRTLFFDLLPMNLGQVHYELTRRQVLAGADGVVVERALAESLEGYTRAQVLLALRRRDVLKQSQGVVHGSLLANTQSKVSARM
jgi:hypothetical protein